MEKEPQNLPLIFYSCVSLGVKIHQRTNWCPQLYAPNARQKTNIPNWRNIEKVEIEIMDNGSGISNEDMSRIFNQGYSSGKSSGTGLGLYYVNKKVNEWGGRIEVFSGKGKTVFFLSLNSPYKESRDEVIL